MPKIGEMSPERTTWLDQLFFAAFDAGDPANPDPKISLLAIRTAEATFENKSLGAGTVITARPLTTVNIGTVPANVVATEEGGLGGRHLTALALTTASGGTSGDSENLATGAKVYTFPAGIILVRAATLSVGVAIADAVKTDTPEIGLGTVLGAGAQATLGAAGATMENIFEGTAIADLNGTVFNGTKMPTAEKAGFIIAAGDSHDVFLNFAAAWANHAAAAALTVTGTIRLVWEFLG